jgi:hypothetical protein
MALLDNNSGDNCLTENRSDGSSLFPVDTTRVAKWIEDVGPTRIGAVRPSVDPVAEYFAGVLECPRKLLEKARKSGRAVSLDSTCKL